MNLPVEEYIHTILTNKRVAGETFYKVLDGGSEWRTFDKDGHFTLFSTAKSTFPSFVQTARLKIQKNYGYRPIGTENVERCSGGSHKDDPNRETGGFWINQLQTSDRADFSRGPSKNDSKMNERFGSSEWDPQMGLRTARKMILKCTFSVRSAFVRLAQSLKIGKVVKQK